MIEGLKLTMTGEEVCALIGQRAEEYRAKAERWKNDAAATLDDQTRGGLLMPQHICENEGARCEWRAERLTFLRDHLDPSEVYRLGEMDLEFAELMRAEPEMLGPDESDSSWPYARRCSSPEIIEIRNPDHPSDDGRNRGDY